MSTLPSAISCAPAPSAAVAALMPARPAGPASRESEGGSFSQCLSHSRAQSQAPADEVAEPARGRSATADNKAFANDPARRPGPAPRRDGADAADGDAARAPVGVADVLDLGGAAIDATGQPPSDATGAAAEAVVRALPGLAPHAADAGVEIALPGDASRARTGETPRGDCADPRAVPATVAGRNDVKAGASGGAAERADGSMAARIDSAPPGDSTALPDDAETPPQMHGAPARAGAARRADRNAPADTHGVRPSDGTVSRADGDSPRDALLADRGNSRATAVDRIASTPGVAVARPIVEPQVGRTARRDPLATGAASPEALALRTDAAAGGEPRVASGAAAVAVESLTVREAPAVRLEAATQIVDAMAGPRTATIMAHAATPVIDAAAPQIASGSIAVPFDAPGFAPALGSRLAVLAREGVHRAELQLNPAEMGPISVQIALDGTRVTVDIGAAVAVTRERLESSLHELAGALREAGLTLAGGGVHEHRRGRDASSQGGAGGAAGRARTLGGAGAGGDGMPAAATARHAPRGVVDLYA